MTTKLEQLRKAVERGDTITRELEMTILALLDLVELQHEVISKVRRSISMVDYISPTQDEWLRGLSVGTRAYKQFNKEQS